MRAEAERQRKRAEDALKKLEAQLEQAQAAEKAARLDAQKALYAIQLQQAQKDNAAKDYAAVKLKQAEDADGNVAKQRAQYEQRRQALLSELKELEAAYKKDMDEVQQRTLQKELEAKRQKDLDAAKQAAQSKQAPPGADKLDRILEQLERLERRLERLEQAAPRGRAGSPGR
jgi:hypothetical protein